MLRGIWETIEVTPLRCTGIENLTGLCIKHIVEYSVTFITVKERVCINLNALKRSEDFFFSSSFVYEWEYIYITIKLPYVL